MRKKIKLITLFILLSHAYVQSNNLNIIKRADNTFAVQIKQTDTKYLTSPQEGLWSVATSWGNDWMGSWVHGSPTHKEEVNGWTILSGNISIGSGKMLVSDSYKTIKPGLIKVVRRYQWQGKESLNQATLSVRFQMQGDNLKPFLPGILYYGNQAGAKTNPNIIAVYNNTPGEFAIFEDHRYSMPFAMLENAGAKFGAAVHTVPSPVRGAILQDQWWSLGVQTLTDCSEFVLYSGPVGYNKKHSVAKALQRTPMRYTDTYINMEPGRIVEKEFYIELFDVASQGSGFQTPIYTSMELFQPYDVEQFPAFEEILQSKINFAQSRWIEKGDAVGFSMYELKLREEFVMGWCGQAASLGFGLQCLEKYSDDPELDNKIQGSLDFLTQAPFEESGIFKVGYNVENKNYFGGDHVSCGQAMYNFAKAIESARKSRKYDTEKWEFFLQKACDLQSERILKEDWRPYSTAEGFYMAPLAIASKLFKNKKYKAAAIKAGKVFAKRHLSMEEPYWGGTLDAVCEDKEGAWAAFQGFLEIYERFGDDKFLVWAKHAMDVCLSYVLVWDIPMPAGRLSDHHFKSTGWTVVSPQNQHLDVFAVLFTPEIYKMGVHLKNDDLKKLARVMYRTCFQLTDARGSAGEQVQQTNFAQHGDMSDVHKLRGGYSETHTVFWITAHFINAAARFEEMDVRP